MRKPIRRWRRFAPGPTRDGVLALTAEIDREAGALVGRMGISPDMARFVTNAYEMVYERIGDIEEPSALAWAMQGVADALAFNIDLKDSGRGRLSDTVANAVIDYFGPTRLPVSLDDLYTKDADLPETLRPLIKDVRDMVAKIPRAKKSRDTMRITRKVARGGCRAFRHAKSVTASLLRRTMPVSKRLASKHTASRPTARTGVARNVIWLLPACRMKLYLRVPCWHRAS